MYELTRLTPEMTKLVKRYRKSMSTQRDMLLLVDMTCDLVYDTLLTALPAEPTKEIK